MFDRIQREREGFTAQATADLASAAHHYQLAHVELAAGRFDHATRANRRAAMHATRASAFATAGQAWALESFAFDCYLETGDQAVGLRQEQRTRTVQDTRADRDRTITRRIALHLEDAAHYYQHDLQTDKRSSLQAARALCRALFDVRRSHRIEQWIDQLTDVSSLEFLRAMGMIPE